MSVRVQSRRASRRRKRSVLSQTADTCNEAPRNYQGRRQRGELQPRVSLVRSEIGSLTDVNSSPLRPPASLTSSYFESIQQPGISRLTKYCWAVARRPAFRQIDQQGEPAQGLSPCKTLAMAQDGASREIATSTLPFFIALLNAGLQVFRDLRPG